MVIVVDSISFQFPIAQLPISGGGGAVCELVGGHEDVEGLEAACWVGVFVEGAHEANEAVELVGRLLFEELVDDLDMLELEG